MSRVFTRRLVLFAAKEVADGSGGVSGTGSNAARCGAKCACARARFAIPISGGRRRCRSGSRPMICRTDIRCDPPQATGSATARSCSRCKRSIQATGASSSSSRAKSPRSGGMTYAMSGSLQTAVYERLGADTGLANELGAAIYDAVPDSAPDLFVAIGAERQSRRPMARARAPSTNSYQHRDPAGRLCLREGRWCPGVRRARRTYHIVCARQTGVASVPARARPSRRRGGDAAHRYAVSRAARRAGQSINRGETKWVYRQERTFS